MERLVGVVQVGIDADIKHKLVASPDQMHTRTQRFAGPAHVRFRRGRVCLSIDIDGSIRPRYRASSIANWRTVGPRRAVESHSHEGRSSGVLWNQSQTSAFLGGFTRRAASNPRNRRRSCCSAKPRLGNYVSHPLRDAPFPRETTRRAVTTRPDFAISIRSPPRSIRIRRKCFRRLPSTAPRNIESKLTCVFQTTTDDAAAQRRNDYEVEQRHPAEPDNGLTVELHALGYDSTTAVPIVHQH